MSSMTKFARWAGVIGVAASMGCKSLDVENPNSPDAARAFADPGAVAGLVTGAFKGWWNAHSEYNSALLLSTMADGLTASWNNFNIRYYASEGNECPVKCGWDNNPSSAFRFQIETYWYGNYAALSSVNDVLTAIRGIDRLKPEAGPTLPPLVIGTAANTKMLEAAALTVQGLVFSEIATNYDQGFVVTELTNLSTPEKVKALNFSTRIQVRDAAMAKFAEAASLWATVTATPPKDWFGKVNQPTYTVADMIRMIHSAQAMTLAFYPTKAADAVNWAQVAGFAAQGVTGAAAEIGYFDDRSDFYDGVKEWGADPTTMRVDTRVAALITDGPEGAAKRHKDPWPDPAGNPQPNAFDKRVGDGTYGFDDDFLLSGTIKFSGNEGSDYLYASKAQFWPARGQYHQSNLGYRRYSYLAYPGYGLPAEDGKGFAPQFTRALNELLWAEALIETGSFLPAATLINKTRVVRGQLSALDGTEGKAALLVALRYEQDIELLGTSASVFYNRRRIDGFKSGTPRLMPVPAKELQVLVKELYTCGGPLIGGGDGSCNTPSGAPPVDESGARVRSVRAIWDDISTASRMEAKRRNRH